MPLRLLLLMFGLCTSQQNNEFHDGLSFTPDDFITRQIIFLQRRRSGHRWLP